MQLFRLTLREYAAPLSGKGAALWGARWNSAGIELIYTAANRSLAMAEVLVHMTFGTVPTDYVMVTINVPDDVSVDVLEKKTLPADWSRFPYTAPTQALGDKFVADGKSCILQVPSVVTAGEFNFLINPHHAEFSRVKIVAIEDFRFDKRLVR